MSLMQPKSGMFRKFAGITLIGHPADEKKYRELLPTGLDLPNEPAISLFIVDYTDVHPWPMSPYGEGGMFLRCHYKGQDYWHTLSMPVTRKVPLWGGRYMGYPKYLADTIFVKEGDTHWEAIIQNKGKTILGFRFREGVVRDVSSLELGLISQNSFFWGGDSLNLYPSGRGPTKKIVKLRHMVEPKWEPQYGMIDVDPESIDGISALIDFDTPYVGMANTFRGGINLLSEEVK